MCLSWYWSLVDSDRGSSCYTLQRNIRDKSFSDLCPLSFITVSNTNICVAADVSCPTNKEETLCFEVLLDEQQWDIFRLYFHINSPLCFPPVYLCGNVSEESAGVLLKPPSGSSSSVVMLRSPLLTLQSLYLRSHRTGSLKQTLNPVDCCGTLAVRSELMFFLLL